MERQKELHAKLGELAAELVSDPEKVREFARQWSSGFWPYSFGNLMLIHFQRPGSSLCAGFNEWKRHKRHVKAGEHALWILAPMLVKAKNEPKEGETEAEPGYFLRGFRSVPIFDVSQTEGEPLELGNRNVKGSSTVSLAAIREAFPEFEHIDVEGLSDGWTDGKKIAVAVRPNESQRIAACLHELAHNFLGHTGEHQRGDISFSGRTLKETEAEAVAFIAAACLGLDNQGSALYVQNWGGDKEKLEKSAIRILGAAEKLVRRIMPGKGEGENA